MNPEEKQKISRIDKIFTIIGIVLCAILIPILIVNCVLLIKGFTNEDEVPSIGGVFPMIVLTDSMDPVFEAGDLIICKKIDAKDVEVEDVITFFDPASTNNSVVTHRVIDKYEKEGKIMFITQGDNNNTIDAEHVSEDDLIGIYTDVHFNGIGNLAMFMQTTPGLILCVFVPIVLFVGYDIFRRKKYEKQHGEDKEALLKELEELRKLKQEQEQIQEE